MSAVEWFCFISLAVGMPIVGAVLVVGGAILLWLVVGLIQFIWKVITLPRFQKEKTIRDCFYEVFGWQIY